MNASKTWEGIRDKTLAKWRELRGLIGKVSGKEFMLETTEKCALCEQAEAVADSLGRKMKCRFCAAYLAYGGCQPIVRKMAEASLDSDWDAIREEVDQVIGKLESAGQEEFQLLETALHDMMEEEGGRSVGGE